MLLYKNLFEVYGTDRWKGVALPTPFYSNQYMPFTRADGLEFTDVALNHLLIQRDDVSIYSTPSATLPILRSPANINSYTISSRNEFTEYNGDMNGTAEGGDLSFGGETIESVIVRRSDSRSKFHIWEDIAVIPVTTASLYTLDKIIYDPYIEHGITYQYAIQPVGSIGRGAQYETLRNQAVYDDIWMIGSDVKQLMMGYNPNVSGYKYVVKDAAIETIGSKYPYVVRNANVGYTQFNFSCTITAHMNVVDGREVFTPFKDIEVLDEYKDIIVGEGGSGTVNPEGSQVERPKPTETPSVTFMTGTRPRSKEREADSDNKTFMQAASNIGPFDLLSKDGEYYGDAVKFKLPIDMVAYINLESEAAKIGMLDAYIKYRDGYTFEDELGNIEEFEPHDWIPAFANKSDVLSITPVGARTVSGEESDIRKNGLPLENAVVESRVRDSNIRAMSNSKVFDPAYPSSPGADKGPIESTLYTINSDNQFMIEREFRNRVMNFLYDGKPKIFKSPTEGLLLVKLTNITLTPNTTLGRMIYDFSCTCTEIGKVNSESLAKYGFRDAIGDVSVVKMDNEIETQLSDEEAKELYGLFRNK